MSAVFHLGLESHHLQQATLAILPGAPERVAKIAAHLEQPQFLAQHREYTIYLGQLAGQKVVVCSTGIGGPSLSIAVEELAQLGVRQFIRVGTTGAIQPQIAVGDMVVTTAAVRLEGASHHFAPINFPAVANFEVTSALKQAAEALQRPVQLGVTVSSDTFYPGQERYDTYCGRVVPHLQGSVQQWQDLGVLNFEMEAATLYTMCASLGLKAGCVSGVIVNRTQNEIPASHDEIEQNTIQVVVEGARRLLAESEHLNNVAEGLAHH